LLTTNSKYESREMVIGVWINTMLREDFVIGFE
jgi:hypothetical protein